MAHILEDRVLESTTTTGTGAITLAGAVVGFRRFNAVCAVSDTVPYFIEALDSLGVPSGDYEYGTGTYSGVNTLTRTTVLGSSNAGAAVNFAAGTKNVGLSFQKVELDKLAPKASPTFTGTPAAPNAALNTRGTQLATMESFNTEFVKSLAASGYQKLPGGLILQWGNVGAVLVGGSSNTDVAVVFPVAFPNTVFGVFPTNGNTGAISFVGAGASAISLTGFNFGLKNSFGSAQSVSGSWMAIGN